MAETKEKVSLKKENVSTPEQPRTLTPEQQKAMHDRYVRDLEKQRKEELRNYNKANELSEAKLEHMRLTIEQENIIDDYEKALKGLEDRAARNRAAKVKARQDAEKKEA